LRGLVSLAAIVTLGVGLAPSAALADQPGLRESLGKLVTPEPTLQQEIAWLREHLASLRGVLEFELARRQFDSDRDAALESFVMGEVLIYYDGLRCSDPPEDPVALAVIERWAPIPRAA
jgi:hypothetical protein